MFKPKIVDRMLVTILKIAWLEHVVMRFTINVRFKQYAIVRADLGEDAFKLKAGPSHQRSVTSKVRVDNILTT